MDAVEFLKEYHRMCKSVDCIKCGLYHLNNETGSNCSEYIEAHPDKAVQIVEQWSKEHPRKTRLQDFLEKYPNAEISSKGVPTRFCPRISVINANMSAIAANFHQNVGANPWRIKRENTRS